MRTAVKTNPNGNGTSQNPSPPAPAVEPPSAVEAPPSAQAAPSPEGGGPPAGDGQTLVSPYSRRPLKAAFGSMISCGYNPRLPERARLYILGLRKSFKSSFMASNPGACIMDFEGGANSVMAPRAYVANLSCTATKAPGDSGYEEERAWLRIPVWDRYLKVKQAMIDDAKSKDPQFTTVGFDSIDLMIEHMMTNFCREAGVENIGDYKSHGAGYARVCERLMRELQDFEDAGYGLMIAAHLGEKTIQKGNDSEIIIRPRISDSFHKSLLMKVDQIVHISLTSSTVMGKKKQNINGVVIEVDDPKNRTTKTEIILRTIPTGSDRERGCRVQIPDGLSLPMADSWRDYAEAYRKEVARVKASQLNGVAA